ncbi:MAG: site-2 protease family protein [Myxococcota bacterium]|nr:site-2 protease family protein [Myxococcota bacterium]
MFEPGSDVPVSPRDRWIALAVGAGFTVLLGLDLASAYHPAKLSVLFMLLAWLPLLALHEAGHALAAHVLGWRLHGIVVGFGRTVFSRTLGGVPVEVRWLPVEGFVRSSPRELAGVRWKSAAIYFAGPGIELVLAALILAAVGPDLLLARSTDLGVIALQSVALAAVMGGVLNLMPHSTWSRDGELPSDGLGILISLARPQEDWAAELRRRRLLGLDED